MLSLNKSEKVLRMLKLINLKLENLKQVYFYISNKRMRYKHTQL